MNATPVATIILAAGGSARLGRPKQFVTIGGTTLLERAVRTACAAALGPVVVVTGSHGPRVAATLASADVAIVANPHWRRGMGVSIGRGVGALGELAPQAGAAILMACDQPAVTADHLRALAARFHAGDSIVGSAFAGQVGIPVLFARAYFPDLLALPPEGGARPLLERDRSLVQSVALPGGEFDVDEPEDLATLDSWP